MKYIYAMITVGSLAFTLPAQAATGDPEVVLYRASGVVENTGGGGNTSTSFSCTPFSGVSENIRVVIRDRGGAQVANFIASRVGHLTTVVASTSNVAIFGDNVLATGAIDGGTVAIAATSTSVTCTAMIIQPNNTAPVGVQLHLIRFNPLAGTTE